MVTFHQVCSYMNKLLSSIVFSGCILFEYNWPISLLLVPLLGAKVTCLFTILWSQFGAHSRDHKDLTLFFFFTLHHSNIMERKKNKIMTGRYMGRRMRSPTSYTGENKDADQLCSYCAFVFATRISQSLIFLNPKFQASSLLL